MALLDLARGVIGMVVKDPLIASNSSIRELSLARAAKEQGLQVVVVADRLSTARPARPNSAMVEGWKAVTLDRNGLYNGPQASEPHHFFVERNQGASMKDTLTRLLPAPHHQEAVSAFIVAYPANVDVTGGIRSVVGSQVTLIADCASLDELFQYNLGPSFDESGLRTSNPAHEVLAPDRLVQYDKALFTSPKSMARAKAALEQVLLARTGQPDFLRAIGANGNLDANLALIDRISKFADVTSEALSNRETVVAHQLMSVLAVPYLSAGELSALGREAEVTTSMPVASQYTLGA